MVDNEIKSLYKALLENGYTSANIGDENTFSTMMSDKGNRKKLYDFVTSNGDDIGDYDTYEKRLSGSTDLPSQNNRAKEYKNAYDEVGKQEDDSLDFLNTQQAQDYTKGYRAEAEKQIAAKQQTEQAADDAKAMRDYLEQSGQLGRLDEMKKKAEMETEKVESQVAPIGMSASFNFVNRLVQRFMNRDYRAAAATRDKIEETQDILDEASHADAGWLDKQAGGVVRGAWDAATRTSTWDFGVTDTADAYAINDILSKQENGEQLTASEQNLLDVMGLTAAIDMAYQDQLGTGYMVGQSLPESAGFMAQMYVNPLSGLGKAAAKKYGTTMVKKIAARAVGDVVGMAGVTATSGAGRVAADYYDRLNGQATFDIDENGIIRYGGQTDQEEADAAIWKAIGSNFIENYTEAIGDYFSPIGEVIGGVARGGLKKMGLNGFADALADIKSSQWSRAIQSFKEKAKFDGFLGELMEEEIGMILNAATVGDQSFNPEDPNYIFNADTQIQTMLSVALMQGTMYAIDAGGSKGGKFIMQNRLNTAERNAANLWGDRWADLKEQLDNSTMEDRARIVEATRNATDLSQEQIKAVDEYAARLTSYQAFNGRVLQNQEEMTEEAKESEAAYEAGVSMTQPEMRYAAEQQRNEANAALEYALEELEGDAQAEANAAISTIRRMVEDGASANEMNNIINGVSNENIARLLRNYVNMNERVKGITDGARNAAQQEVEAFRSSVQDKTSERGTITTATYRDEPVYVLSTSGNNAVIVGQDGKKQMVAMGSLYDVNETPASWLVTRYEEQVLRVALDKLNKDLNHHPKSVAPYPGLPLRNGEQAYVVNGLTEEGNVEVVPATRDTESGLYVPNKNTNAFTISEAEAWALQDEYYAQEEAKVNGDNLSQVEPQNESGPVVENEQNVSEEVQQGEELADESASEAVAPASATIEESIPEDDKGNVLYHKVPVDMTLKSINSEGLEDEEVDAFVAAQQKAADALLKKVNEKPPQVGTNIAKYKREKEAWQARLAEAQAQVDYWNDVKQALADSRVQVGDAVAEEIVGLDEVMSGEELAAQELAHGHIKLQQSSYKEETGYKTGETRGMIGIFRTAENGGVTIDHAAELLVVADEEEHGGRFFGGDSEAARNALLNVLSEVQTRGGLSNYINEIREQQAKREQSAEFEAYEQAIQAMYGVSVAEYEAMEEQIAQVYEGLPITEEQNTEFINTFVDEFNELDNERESERNAYRSEGSSEVLRSEQLDNEGGVRGVEEQSEEVDGGSSDQSEVAQGESRQRLAEAEEQEDILAMAERVANEEKRRKPLRERIKEWEKSGIKVNVLERVEDVPDRAVRAEIRNGSIVPGWYDTAIGEVYILLPHVKDLHDLDVTILHEGISHKGLRVLLGEERFNELCDKVWDMMPKSVKDYFENEYPGVKDIEDPVKRRRAAADEYMAFLAEGQNLTPEDKTIWDKIVELFREIFDGAVNGLLNKSTLTNKDLAELIQLSYANLRSGANAQENVGEKEVKNVILVDTEEKKLPSTREEAFEYIPPKGIAIPNYDQNVEIRVSRNTVKHTTLHNNADEYAIFAAIDQIVGNAVKIGETPVVQDEIGHTHSVSIYYVPINVNGKQYSARLVIKELENKGVVLDELSLYNVSMHKEKGSVVQPLNASKEVGGITTKPNSAYKVKDLIHNTQELDKEILGIEEKTRFRTTYHGRGAMFDRFENGMSNDELYDSLSELSEYSSGAANLINELESYYGGEIISASSGARHAIEYNGLVPFVGEKYDGLEEEYHHIEFEDANGDRFVKSVPFYAPEYVSEQGVRFRAVTDPLKIAELEAGKKVKVYRAMQLVDGKLYPPMSAKVNGKMRDAIELGRLEEAEERPEMADDKGYFKLDKGNGKSLKARYNPYIHTSTTPLNDQFSSAQDRPELVTVEVEIPESELTSGYKADKAKDAVGKLEWKAGVVQGKLSGTRTVILSRWDKPIRIVPDSEVADEIVKMFGDKQITMPRNVVTPSLRAELEKRGVPFVETDNQGKEVGGTRFRVKDRNELVAVHNISEGNLRKVLNVGGLIMPSIAITKYDMGHEGYGDISLLFDKETINPSDRRNKVYGGDAWTPRFPQIVPKISDKVSSNMKKKINGLIEDRKLRENYSLSAELHPDNIERNITNRGIEGYYNEEWMKLAYLLDNGKKVKIPMKMKDYGDMSETIIAMAKDRGLKVSDIQQNSFDFYNNNKDFVEAIKNIEDERKLSSLPEDKRDVARKLFGEKEMRFAHFDTLISAARGMEYDLEHGGLQEILDRAALRETIEKKVKTNNADYNKWVDNLFDGIVEKYGIRNNRDWYTPSGDLRRWEQLYDAATPSNILKYMLAENEQGGSGGFWDSNIMGASAESYDSIEEIREKGKKRLKRLTEEEYDAWSNSIANRMSDICYEFLSPSQREEFGASVDAKIEITNAVAKNKSANGIYKYMKARYPKFTMEHANRVEAIVKEIQDFAIGYFEAKPQRIVPLSEVRKAIVPSGTSNDILDGLKDNGIDVVTYKKGNENARARLIKKESEGIRFRVSEPAIDYAYQEEEIVNVPSGEVIYTMKNIDNQLYKTSGKYMRRLYRYGELGRVLRGEYAEIDQIKAREEYNHAKPILEEYVEELKEMKSLSSEAAQKVINDLISDVDYALEYYKNLSLGKDVWRTDAAPRFRISEEPFYSNAERAVEGIKQEKATPQQWLAMIEKNGGLKAGEYKWLGLSDWLKASDKKSLTKQEVLDYINANQIQIEEVNYGGGEGMKGFYDEILPRFMNKYGKKWGVKVGEVELPHVEESARKMWSVDVTDAMKNSVMEGQPMFRVSNGGLTDAQVKALEFVTGKSREEVVREYGKAKNEAIEAMDELSNHISMGNKFVVINSEEDIAKNLNFIERPFVRLARRNEKVRGVFNRITNRRIIFGDRMPSKKYMKWSILHETTHEAIKAMLKDGSITKADLNNILEYCKDNFPNAYKKATDAHYSSLVEPEESVCFMIGDLYNNYEDNLFGMTTFVENSEIDNLISNILDVIKYGKGKYARSDRQRERRADVGKSRDGNAGRGTEGVDRERRVQATEQGRASGDSEGVRFRVDNSGIFDDAGNEVALVEREVGAARDQYERTLRTATYQFQEAMQDSMLSLKVLQKAIEKATNSRILDFENAWMAENALSSMSLAEMDAYREFLFKPLLQEIANLEKEGLKYEEITDYLITKHGIERNREMAVREALKQDANTYKQNLERWTADKQAVWADDTKTWEEQQAELDRIAVTYGADLSGDYSGLSAMYGDKWSKPAYDAVKSFEAAHNTKPLYDALGKATGATIDKPYESGLMSKEAHEGVKQMFQFYVPLRGWEEETSEDIYEYLTTEAPAFNAPLKKMKGRKSKADDPIATLANVAESSILQGNRNMMKQKFLNMVMNHKSDAVSVSELWLSYDDVADEWKAIYPEIPEGASADEVSRIVEEFDEKMKQLSAAEPDKYKKGSDAKDIPYKTLPQNMSEHQVFVKRGGRVYILTINGNPRAAQALNGLTNPDNDANGAIGAILKSGEWLNRQLSAFYTTRNPNFMASNFLRDAIYSNTMAWVKESPAYAWNFNRNFAKVNPKKIHSLIRKYRNGKLDMRNPIEKAFKEFIQHGGETGYTNLRDVEKQKKVVKRELKKAKKMNLAQAYDMLAERFDDLNRSVENCARFAAYLTSRQQGRSIARSVFDAKEISVNFNKKGAGAKFMGTTGETNVGNVASFISGLGRAGFVFWNAGVQGLYNFGKAAANNPIKFTTACATFYLLGALMPMLADADDDDDDELDNYENLPDYVRRTNICFRNGFGDWVTIPLPIELRALYGLGEMSTMVLSGKEKADAMKIAEQFSQIMPIDMLEGEAGLKVFVPSAVKPVVEAYVWNKDWTGLPIYKDSPYNKQMPEWTKTYKNADPTLIKLSEWSNEFSGGNKYKKGWADWNPAKVEHLLEGYFGGVATTIEQMSKTAQTLFGTMEFDWRNIPIGSRVIKSGNPRVREQRINNEYFDNLDKMDELRQQARGFEKEVDTSKDAFEISKYQKMLNELLESEEYKNFEEFRKMNRNLDKLNKEYKETGDANLEQEMFDLKEAMNEVVRK